MAGYEFPDLSGKQLFTSPVLAKPEVMNCVNICSPVGFTDRPFVYILQQRFPVSQLDILLRIDCEMIQIKGSMPRNNQFKRGKY